MGGPNKPRMPGFSGMGPIPNDEYGDGHMQVDPRYSKRTNANIVNQSTTDGNIGGYENLYGSPGVAPDGYSTGSQGLGMGEQVQYVAQSRGLDGAVSQMRQLFGDDSAAEIINQIMRMAASQDANGQQVRGNLDTTQLPPPDFGNQQPVTTLPPTDKNLMDLEAYYGFPVQVTQPNTPPGRPVINSYPGMPQQSFTDQAYTRMGQAQYAKRRLPKPGR